MGIDANEIRSRRGVEVHTLRRCAVASARCDFPDLAPNVKLEIVLQTIEIEPQGPALSQLKFVKSASP